MKLSRRKKLTVVSNQIVSKEIRGIFSRIFCNHIVVFKFIETSEYGHEILKSSYPDADLFIIVRDKHKQCINRSSWCVEFFYDVFVSEKISDSLRNISDVKLLGIVGVGAWIRISCLKFFPDRKSFNYYLQNQQIKEQQSFYSGLELLALCLGVIRPIQIEDFSKKEALFIEWAEDRGFHVVDVENIIRKFPYVVNS